MNPIDAGEGLGRDMSIALRVKAIEDECDRQARLQFGEKVTRTAYVELCYALTTIKELQAALRARTE